jgi:hypothetical protein
MGRVHKLPLLSPQVLLAFSILPAQDVLWDNRRCEHRQGEGLSVGCEVEKPYRTGTDSIWAEGK